MRIRVLVYPVKRSGIRIVIVGMVGWSPIKRGLQPVPILETGNLEYVPRGDTRDTSLQKGIGIFAVTAV